MKAGERVRWYLVSLGGESDLHAPLARERRRVGRAPHGCGRDLLPASMKVADMVPDDPGTWLFHCHVEDHMMAGMAALYQVDK